jgi:hypothetical protein
MYSYYHFQIDIPPVTEEGRNLSHDPTTDTLQPIMGFYPDKPTVN